ncbi:MAG: hypothetical protein JW885_01175 [Deltaproteobacteria bacterium]|nr:hypothetical protein [Candidatus Zymogenaceae bacterium]
MIQDVALRDKYDMQVDLAKNRIYFYPKGTWNKVSEVPDYINDFKVCARKLRPGFTSLSDAKHFGAPTQEIADLILKGTAMLRESGMKKSAIIVNTSIIKLYLDKYKDEMTKDTLTTMYFESMDEAEEWLDAQ